MSPRRELVEAGAGCGKTYSLVSRYIEGLGYDPETGKSLGSKALKARPSQILAVTFTEEAASQMKERILERLDKIGLSTLKESVLEESQIGTFHGLCLRLIRPHLDRLGFENTSGEIVPPPYARAVRERHALKVLAESSTTPRLLEVLDLYEIAGLAADLWFSSRTPAAAESFFEALSTMKEHFEFFRRETLQMAQDAAFLYPEDARPESKAWLGPLLEALAHPHPGAAEALQFRGGRKLAKERPELLKRAQMYREFLKKDLLAPLKPELLEQEKAAQVELLDFLKKVSETGPKILDYASLEWEFARLLNELAANDQKVLNPSPKLLLVDEFQDTNRLQYSILEHLSGPETEWYFVGDPKQSIYAFRGADVSLFLELRERLTLKSLDTNYRSEAPLLEFINCLQEELFASRGPLDPPPQRLKAAKDGVDLQKPAVRLCSAGRGEDFYPRVLAEIEADRERIGDSLSQAVLFTSWKQLYRFAAHLRATGRAFRIAGSESYLEHPLTHIFTHFLSWLDNLENAHGLMPVLRWQAPLNWSPDLPSPEELEEFLLKLEVGSKSLSWIEILHRFVLIVHPPRWRRGAEWAAAMERFLLQLQRTRLDLELTLQDLSDLISTNIVKLEVDVPELEPDLELELDTGTLVLLTVHGSKGLEFDAVYLPELYESQKRGSSAAVEDDESTVVALKLTDPHSGLQRRSLFYTYRQRLQQMALESEQRRLFYVAVTRAKRFVALYSHDPSESSQAKPDPYAVLGWPAKNPSYWNQVLDSLIQSQALADLESSNDLERTILESTENEEDEVSDVASEDTLLEPEMWAWPEESVPDYPDHPFYREGVSHYLNRSEVDPSSLVSASTDFVESLEKGSKLHQILEIWNGDSESLEGLLPDKPYRESLREAASSIRQLPELDNFWISIVEKPGCVFRELSLLIHSPDYRLSGFADAVWVRGPDDLVILDWKTSSSLQSLSSERRLHRIRRQLELYAESFAPNFKRIYAMAVGVELGQSATERPRVSVILNEELRR